jgi:hypothetical protein
MVALFGLEFVNFPSGKERLESPVLVRQSEEVAAFSITVICSLCRVAETASKASGPNKASGIKDDFMAICLKSASVANSETATDASLRSMVALNRN